jgi:hypothetical protein
MPIESTQQRPPRLQKITRGSESSDKAIGSGHPGPNHEESRIPAMAANSSPAKGKRCFRIGISLTARRT